MNLVITPSDFYKRKIEQAGVMQCPVRYMRNFLPEETAYDGSAKDGGYLLYFGRLSREKGILTLIRGYAVSGTSLKLYIAGQGAMEEKIFALIDELGLQDRVIVLGFLSGERLSELVREATAVCLTSEWYENGPYSIMEAQSFGRPALVTDIGGLPEVVEDGRDGVVCRMGDIASIADGIRKIEAGRPWDTMGIAARAREKYDARAYAEELRRLYTEIIEAGK
jgi:glycosyltransferase involved in cell wall biosynthesis